MTISSETEPKPTNLVRHPIDGHVYTCSGRLIPQPPWIIPADAITQRWYDQWLIDQARDEASSAGDDWLIWRLEKVNANNITKDLRHLMSDYLFGQTVLRFEARYPRQD